MLAPAEAHAHGGLLLSDPAAGATVGATPTAVRLTFSEEPEPSLSTIRVLDGDGGAVQLGGPLPAPGDTRSLVVRVKHLGRGVYTVSWRVVSAVDAHATAGVYAFGVRASPTGNVVVAGATTSRGSSVELTARWLMILGLVTIVGAAAASVGRFGGPRDVMLGWVGLFLTVAGLVLLAVAQYRTAGVSVGELLETTAGRALVWRGLAVAAGGLRPDRCRSLTESPSGSDGRRRSRGCRRDRPPCLGGTCCGGPVSTGRERRGAVDPFRRGRDLARWPRGAAPRRTRRSLGREGRGRAPLFVGRGRGSARRRGNGRAARRRRALDVGRAHLDWLWPRGPGEGGAPDARGGTRSRQPSPQRAHGGI